LRLVAQDAAEEWGRNPHFLLQKFPARAFVVETILEFTSQAGGDEAGLVIAGRNSAALILRRTAAGLNVEFRTNSGIEALAQCPGRSICLRVKVTPGGRCSFSYCFEPGGAVLGTRDFQAEAGIWIGAKVGIYCSRTKPESAAYADFDFFRFAPIA
jgi:hypothetical protein